MGKAFTKDKIKSAFEKRKQQQEQTKDIEDIFQQLLKKCQKCLKDIQTKQTLLNNQIVEHKNLNCYLNQQLKGISTADMSLNDFNKIIELSLICLKCDSEARWLQLGCKVKKANDLKWISTSGINLIIEILRHIDTLEVIDAPVHREIRHVLQTQQNNSEWLAFCDNLLKASLDSALKSMTYVIRHQDLIDTMLKNQQNQISKTQYCILKKQVTAANLKHFNESLYNITKLIKSFVKIILAGHLYHHHDYYHYAQTQNKGEAYLIESKHWYNQNMCLLNMLCEPCANIDKKHQKSLQSINRSFAQLKQTIQKIKTYTPDKKAILAGDVVTGKYFQKSQHDVIPFIAFMVRDLVDPTILFTLIHKKYSGYKLEQLKGLERFAVQLEQNRVDHSNHPFYNSDYMEFIHFIASKGLHIESDRSAKNKVNRLLKKQPISLFEHFAKINEISDHSAILSDVAEKYLNTLEACYLSLFKQIDPIEICHYQNHKNLLGQSQFLPNLTKYKSFDNSVNIYLLVTIFYTIRKQFTVKKSYKQVNSTIHFYHLALQIANEKRLKVAQHVLKRALSNTVVEQFCEEKGIQLSQLKKVSSKLNILSSLLHHDSQEITHLDDFMREQFVRFSQDKGIERKLFPGFLAYHFQELKNKFEGDSNIKVLLDPLIRPLLEEGVLENRIQTISIDQSYLDKILKNSLIPFISSKHIVSSSQFRSIEDFRRYAHEQYQRANKMVFTSMTPMENLTGLFGEWIKDDLEFVRVQSVLAALWEVRFCFEHGCVPTGRFEELLHLVLVEYQLVLDKALSELHRMDKGLERFFQALNSSKLTLWLNRYDLLGLKDNDLLRRSKLILDQLYAKERDYLLDTQLSFVSHSQHAMTELLDCIISGRQIDRKIFAQRITKEVPELIDSLKNSEIMRYLLPEVYPDDPAANLEKSRYFKVGNEGMDSDAIRVNDIFHPKQLISEFEESFPWALAIDDHDALDKLDTHELLDTHNEDHDLLYMDNPLPAEDQYIILKAILIAYDILGKLTGEDGEYSIHNYVSIRNVIDDINDINEQVLLFIENPDKARDSINDKIAALIKYHDTILTTPPETVVVSENEAINRFCHINHLLVSKLTGIESKNMSLFPQQLID